MSLCRRQAARAARRQAARLHAARRYASGSLWALLIFAVACAPDFEFREWSLPVDDTASRIGHFAAASREGTIELVEQQVVGRGTDPDALFGRNPPRVAVADSGRLFVLDASNHRVQIFEPDGTLRGTAGRQGQGPGEFGQPLELFIAGGVLHVWDVINRRVSRFDPDGELIDDRATPLWGGMIHPYAGGEMVWRRGERTPDGQILHYRRVDARGQELVNYATVPWPLRTIDPPLAEIVNSEPDAWWVGTVPPAFAADAAGTVYVSLFADYEIFAFEPDGRMRWAMQVEYERPPISQQEIDLHMELHARRFPDRTAAQVDWPEREYALADIKVDGHGHIYVFPYVAKGTPPDQSRPVDVYTSAGERLFTGWLEGRMFEAASATYNGTMYEVAWQVARDDSVWGVARTPDSGDWEVVRYRLEEPF